MNYVLTRVEGGMKQGDEGINGGVKAMVQRVDFEHEKGWVEQFDRGSET